MLQMIRRTTRFHKLIYVLSASLVILAFACSSGSSAAIDESDELISTATSDGEQLVSAPSSDSVDAITDESNILGYDVVQLLYRYGVRPEGVQPSVRVTLANSAYFAATGEPIPGDHVDVPSLIFIVDEEAHEDLPADLPRPLLNIDGQGAYEPLNVTLRDDDRSGDDGTHHRKMVVSYALNGPDGMPLVGPETDSLELIFGGEFEDGTEFNQMLWNLPIVYADGVQSKDVTPEFSDSDKVLKRMIKTDALNTGAVELAEQSIESDLLVRVVLTDEGSSPESISLALGQQVALVIRNVGDEEHHFHIKGLPTDELLWYAKEGTIVSGSPMVMDHDGTGAEAVDAMDQTGMDAEIDVSNEDDFFVSSGELVSHHVCTSETGVCPSGDWVHAHAEAGDWDIIVFTPTERGTFTAFDPLNPDLTSEVIVY